MKKSFKIAKVDDELGLVFGYAIICTEKDEPYYDTQEDHIPEETMLKAALDFSENSAVVKDMHAGEPKGSCVFMFPLTKQIAESLNIETDKTGLLVAVKPEKDMLNKFKSGELTGFSIGGVATTIADVA